MDMVVQRMNDRMLINVRDNRDGKEDKATAFSLGAKKIRAANAIVDRHRPSSQLERAGASTASSA